MPTNDDDDRPRARRASDDDDGEERPRRRSDEDDEDYGDPGDRPRRRRRSRGDDTGGLIPYKNPKALAAYYCGVFGLISCFLFLGIFGIVPIVLGFLGLKHARQYPEAKGQAHAITGIVLGFLELLTFLAGVGYIIVMVASGK